DGDVQPGPTESPSAGDRQRNLLGPDEEDPRQVLLVLAGQLRVRGEVDVGAAGGPVVDAGPDADPANGVDDDDLAPGPRPLTDGLADDEVLLDRAGALDRLLVRAV